ncbi:MAG: 16S rRNA (cytosine(1402)-N(4))-methyltransferase RsmH [Phycisphaerae bacterium]|jgi:16S rRNA (cytosine1402-N4)-methyltransferase
MDITPAHTPVLREQVLELLAPRGRSVLVDCTIGLGGHAEAMLAAAGEQAQLIGIDVDEDNLRLARQRLERFGRRVRLFQANFAELTEVLSVAAVQKVDAVLADLGIASSQLDDPQRGLSFSSPGPLDMRLDMRMERTAADFVNSLPEEKLADLIYLYGEERFSRRIARAIVAARRTARIERTDELSRIVSCAIPRPAASARRGVHPATRTFQALRIAVNEELSKLEYLLSVLPEVLAVGGRAAIISFHSLEDRRVKQSFAAWTQQGQARLLTRKPVIPSAQEAAENPRSRSAKLRAIEKVA